MEKYEADDYDGCRGGFLAVFVYWDGVWIACLGEVRWALEGEVLIEHFQRA